VPPSVSGPGTPGSNTDEPPASLKEQLGRWRKALFGLVGSHVALARAEFSEIAGEIKRVAALVGGALFLLFLTGILIVVGILLFAGEAIFGSMGWGVLLGSELLIGVAALMVMGVLELGWGRVGWSFLVAVGVGLVIGGLQAANWTEIGKHNSGLFAQPWLAILSGAVLVGLLGALLASSFGRAIASAAAVVGVIVGALLGWLTSAGPDWRVAAAIGVAFGLLVWPVTAAVLLFRHGVDTNRLRERFVPEVTIETTKETIEWVRAQLPLGPKS
jgi:hypothetical protein